MALDANRATELLPALMRYARRLTRNEDEAEDLVQETLASAYASASSYHVGRSLRIWLFAIMHNSFVSRARHESVRARYRAKSLPTEADPSPQEHAVRLGQIAAALDRLSPEQRQVLHLVAVEGLSYQEAADVVRIPIGTLISRLSRARARLRAIEDGDLDESAPVSLRIVEN